jgi:hypothetical protein
MISVRKHFREYKRVPKLTDINQVFVSSVLKVVCAGSRDISYVTGLEVECSARFGRYVDG